MKKFKVNDRVRRLPYKVVISQIDTESQELEDEKTNIETTSVRGPIGTVKAIRHETSNSLEDSKENTLMIQVLWDNGTLSHHGPDGLELSK